MIDDSPIPIDFISLQAAGRLVQSLDGCDPRDDEGDYPNIAGYTISGSIGHGSGGQVYQAVADGLEQIVAIKILHQPMSAPSSGRAWRELEALSHLRLDSVPRLIDHGVHEGRLYLVTEFIEGPTLLEHVEQEPLDDSARVELLIQICSAVQRLHEHGVIHRDLKPRNILITTTGQPVIVDLGLAMLLSIDPVGKLTLTGAALGTLGYMAPEQARGDLAAVSTRSDVYSLGALAYRVLCGGTPHDMEAAPESALHKIAHESPRSPRDLHPKLPGPLEAILAQAVQSSPSDRYASADELARDFQRYQRGEIVRATPRSFVSRVVVLAVRFPLRMTIAACAFMIILTMVGSILVALSWNMRPARATFERDRVTLLSHSGAALQTWDVHDSRPPASMNSRYLIPVSEAIGSDRLLVVSLGEPYRFEVYNVDQDLDQPLWSRSIRDSDLPEGTSVSAADFNVQWLFAFDIYDRSGPEIVVIHQHVHGTSCALQIYGTDGELLHQSWHNGNLIQALWHPELGQLILTGVDGRRTWADLGYDNVQGHPRYVFAIEPIEGEIRRTWLNPRSGTASDVKWSRWIGPPRDYVGVSLSIPDIMEHRDRSVYVAIQFDKEFDVRWTVDGDGELVEADAALTDWSITARRDDSEHFLHDLSLDDRPPSEWGARMP